MSKSVRGSVAGRLVDMGHHQRCSQRLKTGQAQYFVVCCTAWRIRRDILVHKVADDQYFSASNASNHGKGLRPHRRAQSGTCISSSRGRVNGASSDPKDPRLANVAEAEEIDLASVAYFTLSMAVVCGDHGQDRATGYTVEMVSRFTLRLNTPSGSGTASRRGPGVRHQPSA